MFVVELDGFNEVFVEARSKPSARWLAASAAHDAGYGRSPIDLLKRGCRVSPASSLELLFVETAFYSCLRASAPLREPQTSD